MTKEVTMDTQKGINVIHWVKNHKFWTSAIVLFIVTIAVRIFGKPLEYVALSTFFFYYTMIGGLIWSGYVGKQGMTLITWGVISALLSLYSWWTIISNWEFEPVVFIFAVIFPILSGLLIYLGVKRYKNWLKSDADTSASSS